MLEVFVSHHATNKTAWECMNKQDQRLLARGNPPKYLLFIIIRRWKMFHRLQEQLNHHHQ